MTRLRLPVMALFAGAVVATAMLAGPGAAQIVPPFTSFGPGAAPNFIPPVVPRPPHPRPPMPVPFPIFGFASDTGTAAPSNVNIIVNPAPYPPAPPPPPVVYNPPSTEMSPSGVEVVRLMSTSPAR